MKMDSYLIRKILLEIETADGTCRDLSPIEIEGFTDCEINFQVHIMIDEGLLEGDDISNQDDPYDKFWVKRMTSYGHNFLNLCRSETNFKRGITFIKELGVDVTFDFLSYAVYYVSDHFKSNRCGYWITYII